MEKPTDRSKTLGISNKNKEKNSADRSMKNLLIQWKLRKKTDPKLELQGYCFLAFLLELLVGDWSHSCLVL